MNVTLVGDDPAVEAVDAALSDADVATDRTTATSAGGSAFSVVSGVAGASQFTTAAEAIDGPWCSIEIGGLGGVGLDGVDAGIALYGDSCYDCLCERVQGRDDVPTASPSGDRSAVRLAGAIAGREIVRVLSGDRSSLDSVVEVPYTERPLLPVPACCADRLSRDPDYDYERRGVEATAAAVERAVDERVGPVRAVGEAESFPAPYYLATMAATDGFSDASVPEQAAGVDDGWNSAYVKAAGEGLERYAASVYRTDSLRNAAPASLAGAVPPAAFAAADDDAPAAGNATDERAWLRGHDLSDRSDVWLPAQAVLFPPPSSPDIPAITTGLGLGSSGVGALLSGLTEVIERDATMLAWYSTFEPLGLTVEDEGFDALARRARAEGLTVTPLVVTQDIDVPVVTVAVHRDGAWPQFAVGAAASLDPVDAARSALAEAIQNWMELRSLGEEAAAEQSGQIGAYAQFPQQAAAMIDVEDRVPATAIGPDEAPTGENALEALLDRLAEVGLAAYATRLTTRDLDAIGFEAARVVVPGAQPLFTGDARFGERAETVPEKLGFEPRLRRRHHPYP